MESGYGTLSVADDGGLVCHLCGYTYPVSGLEPAHSKICYKPISTPATEEGAGELGDRGLLLGWDVGERRRRTGSIEVGDAAQNGGNSGICSSAPKIVEPQQQHNCTSVTEDRLAIPKEADNVCGQHYPITDGGAGAISPAVDVVISVGGAPNIKDNGCLSEGAIGDITKRNAISGTAMPAQCGLVEFSTCMMAQNGKVCPDPIPNEIPKNLELKQEVTGVELTSHEINEMLSPENVEEKEQHKEVTANLGCHEIIAETSASTSSSTVLPHEGSTDTLEHMRGRGVLLETPTGFAMFTIKEPLDAETAWMHFMGKNTAKMVVSFTGFIKMDVKSAVWGEGDGGTSKSLEDLIRKSLKDKTELLVDAKFKDVVERKFGITCCDDDGIHGDLIWGLKNVLREFMPDEEKHSITKEYYFPLSKGWNEFLIKYSISVPATMRDSYLMSKIYLLRSLDLTLERGPRNLRKSFDKHVNGIGNHIKDNFMYVLVLARILVPELTPNYNFSQMFSSDMVLKIEEAKRFASNYREEKLTLYDIQIILGALDHLGVVPGQIESVVAFIKLRLKEIEVATRCDEEEKITRKDGHGKRIMQNEKRSIWHHMVGLLVLGGIVMQFVTV